MGREEQFDDDEIEQFQAENRWLMQQRQEETDPEDRRRRRYQMQLLEEVKSRFHVLMLEVGSVRSRAADPTIDASSPSIDMPRN
ncbi:hypothetical protein C2W62_31905 [Candidatus Entotheonella serta]|nr:hypothetical protein C2W62_31905 [Candidatus Entotheonella serta]